MEIIKNFSKDISDNVIYPISVLYAHKQMKAQYLLENI